MKRRLNYNCLLYRNEDFFSNLYDYILQIDSEWRQSIVPATDNEIKYLTKVFRIDKKNHQLPQSYIKYLQLMGNYDGEIFYSSLQNYIYCLCAFHLNCEVDFLEKKELPV